MANLNLNIAPPSAADLAAMPKYDPATGTYSASAPPPLPAVPE